MPRNLTASTGPERADLAERPVDVAIIGAGHNGLVAAAYLAAAGLSVALFERRAIVGGAAVTEEFTPGFRNSTASYTVSLLHPKIIRDLRLADHGLRIVPRPMQNSLPLPDGDCLCVPAPAGALAAQVARHSKRDAARLPQWQALLGEAAELVRALLLQGRPARPLRLKRVPWTDAARGRWRAPAARRPAARRCPSSSCPPWRGRNSRTD